MKARLKIFNSFQALRIAQQREKSRDYFEKHRQEVLKKRKRMFNQSKETGSDGDNQLQQELDNSHCKHCFKPFKNLRGLWSHIAQMVPCRKFYGEEALLEMKENLAQLLCGKLKRKQQRTKVKSDKDAEGSDGEGLENFVEEGEGADNSEEAKKRRQQYYQQNKPTR
jgi:hypothetical protein